MLNPAAGQPRAYPRLAAAGRRSFPIKIGNETIGAIGVGDAPGGHLNEQCAVAALYKFKDQLK